MEVIELMSCTHISNSVAGEQRDDEVYSYSAVTRELCPRS